MYGKCMHDNNFPHTFSLMYGIYYYHATIIITQKIIITYVIIWGVTPNPPGTPLPVSTHHPPAVADQGVQPKSGSGPGGPAKNMAADQGWCLDTVGLLHQGGR